MRGRELTRETGSAMLEMMSFVLEAKLELRLNRDAAAAIAALDRFEAHPAARSYRYVFEYADTWYGFALLLTGRNDDARVRLRRAVEGMVAGKRILELPTAAVYLAEAEWRSGDEDAADSAADVALRVAREQGSNQLLLQALTDFPAVVSRRLDAEAAGESAWHDIGRALRAQGVLLESPIGPRIELKDFGRIVIRVNGQEAVPRIGKSAELLAYLVHRQVDEVEKDELLDALFAGRANEAARSYLRQAVRRLREILPPDVTLATEGPVVRLTGAEFTSESRRFDELLALASRLQGEERFAATIEALELAAQGEYLPTVTSDWADERRAEIAERVNDARVDAAEIAFAAGRYREAEQLTDAVLKRDRFREAAWRLLMRIDSALGDQDKVISAYRHCEESLRSIGASPSETTRRLLAALRR